MLAGASEGVIYPDYSPVARVLPGYRYAYDKGGDPYSLIMSMRGPMWREQTDAYFKSLDLRGL